MNHKNKIMCKYLQGLVYGHLENPNVWQQQVLGSWFLLLLLVWELHNTWKFWGIDHELLLDHFSSRVDWGPCSFGVSNLGYLKCKAVLHASILLSYLPGSDTEFF